MELRVECRPSSAAGGGLDEPVRFGWGEPSRTAVEILDRWPGDDHCYFRLRGDDGAVYILRHDHPSRSWHLVFFSHE